MDFQTWMRRKVLSSISRLRFPFHVLRYPAAALPFSISGESGILLVTFDALVASNGSGPVASLQRNYFCTKGAMKMSSPMNKVNELKDTQHPQMQSESDETIHPPHQS